MEKNLVTISGYLKENTLEKIISKTGKNAIRGNLIIATSDIESHRVQFYVSETTSSGAESKDYKSMLDLLPEKTVTIATVLEEDQQASFADACERATKVWISGYLDEYAKRSETGEISIIQVRGRRGGIRVPTATSAPFEPKTRFEAEVYVYEKSPELDVLGNETGRINITGLIANYDNSVIKVGFVAPVEDGVADYVNGNFAVSDTIHINGVLVNTMHRVLVESATENHFGSGGRDQYSTTFVNERVILGGDAKPIKEGEEGSITKNAVKIGLAKRESKIQSNSAFAASAAQTKGFTTAKTALTGRSTDDVEEF